jgi:hypothetical protein
MNKLTLGALVLGLATAMVSTTAQAEDFALGVKGGTIGLGFEGVYRLSEQINLRAQHTQFSTDVDESSSGGSSDLDFNLDLDIGMTALMLDYHPFNGSFRLTAGYAKNANQLSGSAVPSGSYEIGDKIYTAAEIGNVNATIDFKSAAPYLGFGWGNAVSPDNGFGVSFEVGVLLQGAPKINLTTTKQLPTAALQQQLEANIAKETATFEDDTKSFKAWPVVALGVSYQF